MNVHEFVNIKPN